MFNILNIINILSLFTLINACSNTTVSSLTSPSLIVTDGLIEPPVLTLASTTTTGEKIIEIVNSGHVNDIYNIVYVGLSIGILTT